MYYFEVTQSGRMTTMSNSVRNNNSVSPVRKICRKKSATSEKQHLLKIACFNLGKKKAFSELWIPAATASLEAL